MLLYRSVNLPRFDSLCSCRTTSLRFDVHLSYSANLPKDIRQTRSEASDLQTILIDQSAVYFTVTSKYLLRMKEHAQTQPYIRGAKVRFEEGAGAVGHSQAHPQDFQEQPRTISISRAKLHRVAVSSIARALAFRQETYSRPLCEPSEIPLLARLPLVVCHTKDSAL